MTQMKISQMMQVCGMSQYHLRWAAQDLRDRVSSALLIEALFCQVLDLFLLAMPGQHPTRLQDHVTALRPSIGTILIALLLHTQSDQPKYRPSSHPVTSSDQIEHDRGISPWAN